MQGAIVTFGTSRAYNRMKTNSIVSSRRAGEQAFKRQEGNVCLSAGSIRQFMSQAETKMCPESFILRF